MGEIWHFAGDFLAGDEWDSVMNYPFYYAVLELAASQTMGASAFMDRLGFMRGNLNRALDGYLWNFIDSHDTARFLHSAGKSVKKQKLAAALQLLLPGMPMIYYGDEAGMEGGPDPDCRRGMLWEEDRRNGALFAYYQALIQLRHQYPVLTEGELVEAYAQDETGLIRMERALGDQRMTILFHTQKGTVALPGLRGRENLVTRAPFPGRLGGYEAAVLMG